MKDSQCKSVSPFGGINRCSRARGHDGDHVTLGRQAQIIAKWSVTPTDVVFMAAARYFDRGLSKAEFLADAAEMFDKVTQ